MRAGSDVVLLEIRAQKDDRHSPYAFRMATVQMHDRLVSGRVVRSIEREGTVRTSANELLLTQQNFREVTQRNKSKAGSVIWPAEEYEPPVTERDFRSSYDLVILQFGAGGNLLLGDEYVFRRAGSLAQGTPTAVVAFSDPDQKRAVVVSFDRPAASFRQEAKGAAQVRVLGRDQFRYTVESATPLVAGQALYAGAEAIAPKGQLSREEILKRIKRGEKVSKEDLIRALAPESKTKP